MIHLKKLHFRALVSEMKRNKGHYIIIIIIIMQYENSCNTHILELCNVPCLWIFFRILICLKIKVIKVILNEGVEYESKSFKRIVIYSFNSKIKATNRQFVVSFKYWHGNWLYICGHCVFPSLFQANAGVVTRGKHRPKLNSSNFTSSWVSHVVIRHWL